MEKISKQKRDSVRTAAGRTMYTLYLEQLITSDSKYNEEVKRIIGSQNKLYFYNMFYNHINTETINDEATASEPRCLGKD